MQQLDSKGSGADSQGQSAGNVFQPLVELLKETLE